MNSNIVKAAASTVDRLYRSIPFRLAGELHSILRSDASNPQTRALVRQSLIRAGMVKRG